MKERASWPMKDWEVRAIIDGRKTQKRVIVKPQPRIIHATHSDASISTERIFRNGDQRIHCPFGQTGDQLWGRETWQGPLWPDDDPYPENGFSPKYCEYKADGGETPWYVDSDDNIREGWQPSIHMPRWASRITLEITGVRFERLWDISEEDAKAEGAPAWTGALQSYKTSYFHIWESINGKGSLDENPFVWVISFKRIDK